MQKPTPPSLRSPRFNCPHCDALAHQEWVELGYVDSEHDFRYMARWNSDPWGGDNSSPISTWSGAQCFSCSKWSVWCQFDMVYPPARLGGEPHLDMPEEIRDLYDEAARVAVVSRRAGAALARATVERLIKHLDRDAPKGLNLAARIARVKARGVSSELGKMLDVVRETGNDVLHGEQPGDLAVLVLDDRDGPAMLELLLETANDLVDELITRPKTAGELWDKLPAGVKAKLSSAGPSTSTGTST